MFWWSGIAYTLAILFSSYIFIPLFMGLNITSAYEYLERRYNRYVKVLASVIFMVQTVKIKLYNFFPKNSVHRILLSHCTSSSGCGFRLFVWRRLSMERSYRLFAQRRPVGNRPLIHRLAGSERERERERGG